MSDLLSLEQARRDVRAKTRAAREALEALWDTRGCSALVHVDFTAGCPRCEAELKAGIAADVAEHALDVALRRLEAVESQQREPQWIGGER